VDDAFEDSAEEGMSSARKAWVEGRFIRALRAMGFFWVDRVRMVA